MKVHLSYSVDEAARCLGVHKATIRQWIKQGLPALTEIRPTLIVGSELRAFLRQKRLAGKRPCGAGEIYCVRCRAPRRPAAGIADYEALSESGGRLVGLCPSCEAVIYRRVSIKSFSAAAGDLDVTCTKGQEHIVDSAHPFVNLHFKAGA